MREREWKGERKGMEEMGGKREGQGRGGEGRPGRSYAREPSGGEGQKRSEGTSYICLSLAMPQTC